MNAILNKLKSDEFLVSFGVVCPGKSFIKALEKSSLVQDIKNGIISGQITESDIEQFINKTDEEFVRGQAFAYDISYAALAVALIDQRLKIGDQFIIELASLRITEIQIATIVAETLILNKKNKLHEKDILTCVNLYTFCKKILDIKNNTGIFTDTKNQKLLDQYLEDMEKYIVKIDQEVENV